MRTRGSYSIIVAAAVVIGGITSIAGITIDHALHHVRPLYASDMIDGVAAALLSGTALFRAQSRKRDLLARIQAVEDVNHHVRNALTAMTYSAVLREDPVLDAIVRDANARIDWTLREVLPRTVDSFRASPNPFLNDGRWCAGLELHPDENRDRVDQESQQAD